MRSHRGGSMATLVASPHSGTSLAGRRRRCCQPSCTRGRMAQARASSEGRMKFHLRMTGSQHAALQAHLFLGDGNEAVGLLLCGRRAGTTRHVLTVAVP